MFGKHHNEETLQKMRLAKLGTKNRMYGRHHSEETRLKMKLAMLGERNPMWQGDEVKYGALHDWVKCQKPKPTLCEECNKRPPFDLASISHKYTRELSDWQWICRRCHMIKDGRIKNLVQFKFS